MKTVVVTGGSGKAGRAVVRELLAHGYGVLNVDLVPSPDPVCPFLRADLTDPAQCIDMLRPAPGVEDLGTRKPFRNADAVVHLAAIRAPGLMTEAETFRINMLSTYNVFSAATLFGLTRVVWASSETTLGLPFRRTRPDRIPVDETQTLLPESGYALTKVLSEEMARQMHRWNPGTTLIGLRISNVKEPAEYIDFPSFSSDPTLRAWNLWSYVDARDVAQACRLGLEAAFTGADHFIIAAADTVMTIPNAELVARVFPDVPVARDLGEHETMLSIDKARRVLGYAPHHTWRTAVAGSEKRS
ncbi:MAG TPA: NAD(P)-dependent oxidoreductase [Acetobacteraceae bacterium]|jgi:nucleoside-diphosphate-sugar epimerase|nr:NAD(P)-dependent oxidoreductase [Acetobacteraceae bacterium]